LDQGQNLLAELPATQFSYTLRNMDKDKLYRFAVTAVDSQGLESEPATTSINGEAQVERSKRRAVRNLKRPQ
jgi:hypothetical protein